MAYKFGIVAMLSGVIGVPLGSVMARRLRPINPSVDPLICAYGLIISSPFIYFSLIAVRYSASLCYFLIFMAEVTLNLTWSIVADMILVS